MDGCQEGFKVGVDVRIPAPGGPDLAILAYGPDILAPGPDPGPEARNAGLAQPALRRLHERP